MSEAMEITDKLPEKKRSFKPLFGVKARALLRKNFLIFIRNKTATFIQLAFPVCICLYLSLIQVVVDGFAETTADPSPQIYGSQIPRCIGKDCVSLEIVIAGDSTNWTDFVIPHISKQSGFPIGKDIQVTQQSALSFMNSLDQNRNKTQVGLILCTSQLDLQENPLLDSIPCQTYNSTGYFYSIVFNYTTILNQGGDNFLKPHYFSDPAIGVKNAIDNAIFAYEQSKQLHGDASISVEPYYSSFPSSINRYMKNYDVSSKQGPLYYFVPPMVLFGMIVAEIAREKEQKLRYGLIITGISHREFWFSWFGIALCVVFVASNVQIFAGYLLNFDFFLRTPYLILLMTFVTFGMSMMVIGFFLATLLPTARSAYTVSYAFFLVGFVFQMFFADWYLIKALFSEVLPSWARWVVVILSSYPPFMFAVIVETINDKSSYVYRHKSRVWAQGSGYAWSDFAKTRRGRFYGKDYAIPSVMLALTIIIFDSLVIAALAWYFDHVIEGNRGKKYPLHFLFTKQYWRENNSRTSKAMISKSEGLVLDGLEKVYSRGVFKKVRKQAVLPLHFTVSNDQLLALIGHNGAGKTTLINMLTGLLAPTSGTAYINGFDLIYDFSSISKIIGYCPQHDILWDQLTAREHLKMFCVFKSVKWVDATIEKTLLEIGLVEDADTLVKGFSGGMKRRLSVGIASLGDPKIVFLDEPTTGMDPVSKKLVWKLIKDLKQDRVVILTTHSMEEADILSDNIAVMVDGSIKCMGTSLYLKNEYGEGYKINIVSPEPRDCWDELWAMYPHIHLIDISAGSLLISLPKEYPEEIEAFLEDMENNKYGKMVEEWSLSNSSLEEVFMKLTDKKVHHY